MSDRPTRRILLVDDSTDDREMIRRALRGSDRSYEFEEADTGRAGLAAIRKRKPDCVILDFYLPDMTGLDFLEGLSWNSSEGLPLPVVVLTGTDSEDLGLETLRRGAQDYLVKQALTGPGLSRAIENAIDRHTIHRELLQNRLAIELRNRKLEVLRDQLQEKVTELADATRTKDQFMAVMSHEMRTPLNAIIGYADLLQLEIDGELTPGQREQIERIQVGGRHLLDLINDVLDLARADANKLNLDRRPVGVGAVIEEVVALLESQAREKSIALIADPIDPGLPPILADLHRFRQILMNLVGNAIKFTDEGEVRVRCSQVNGSIRIDVIDTGIGISAEAIPMIFSDFFQVRGELTREKGGTGLGLAIARRLANLMDGDIHANSVPGEGSTFSLVLPAADLGSELRVEDVLEQAGRMEGHAAAAAQRTARAVSVVAYGDQEESLRELERQVHPGVRLRWTTRPEDVAQLAVEEKAALVVLDIGSAKGAAWSAAHALQNVPELTQTAILLLPSIPEIGDDEVEAGALNLGWLSLVPKPFTAAQLTHAVSTAGRRDENEEEEDAVRQTTPREVLVVDDDPDSRRVAAKFLEEARLLVREAPDGETALIEMHRRRPDVVVLDLMMPVLDGFGVLATMRADAALASIPVVVLTAKSLTDAERQFLARTAVRVLQKGEHRLADVAALVLRAAGRTRQGGAVPREMG